uniref:Tetratricopeptide repeat protein n=1 Tax=Panagrolaimus sp. PS1159 TaxID=55785 RepID=A0AC35FZ65_9BILA
MSLKDYLKDIGLLIKAGKYDEAEQKVIAIEKAGNANTLIFLCGLRCATENEKLSSALLYIQKVKEAYPNNPEINKAECSVYEKFPEQITKDSLSVIDKVIADEKISDARRANLKRVKWSTMIRLGLINEFRQLDDYSEAIKNVEICCQIVVASVLDKKISQEMARTAFLLVKDELSQEHHLYGTLLFLNESEFDQFAFEHAIRFGCVDPNIMKNVYEKIVYQLIKNGQLSSPFANAVEVPDFIPQKKSTTEWLTHLFSNEVANAYDCLKKLSQDDYLTWPLSGLAFYTFFATRQFAMLIKLYRSTVFPDENIFKILELEAIFENYADEAE